MKAPIPCPAEMITSQSSSFLFYFTHSANSTSYARIDPAQEISRIRQSISLLESFIYPHQRSVATPRRSSDAALITPKKEPVEPDVSDKSPAAPGMLGTQQQGGLYAGPTSAATHLLMVSMAGSSLVKKLILFSSDLTFSPRQKVVIRMTLRGNKVRIASMKTFRQCRRITIAIYSLSSLLLILLMDSFSIISNIVIGFTGTLTTSRFPPNGSDTSLEPMPTVSFLQQHVP